MAVYEIFPIELLRSSISAQPVYNREVGPGDWALAH